MKHAAYGRTLQLYDSPGPGDIPKVYQHCVIGVQSAGIWPKGWSCIWVGLQSLG